MRALDSGLVIDRDHNAAINILFRGEASGPQSYGSVEASGFSQGYFTTPCCTRWPGNGHSGVWVGRWKPIRLFTKRAWAAISLPLLC
jgi:hypothetical protein